VTKKEETNIEENCHKKNPGNNYYRGM